jgi:CheY-like chemotaxis protein
MQIQEHYTIASLEALLSDITQCSDTSWGLVSVRKDCLKQITNEALLTSIAPVLSAASTVHVFFLDKNALFIAWKGKRKKVYRGMLSMFGAVLALPGLTMEPSKIVAYINTSKQNNTLNHLVKKTTDQAAASSEVDDILASIIDDDDDEEDGQEDAALAVIDQNMGLLAATQAQIDLFQHTKLQKNNRKQLHALIVEDQVFSQKLLSDIIRSARGEANDTPVVEAAQSVQGAWKAFLKLVPDIVFVDLGLADGSGHSLAKAIKSFDPRTPVIIVTANDSEEEMIVARQNNVDSFISKPYSKKAIFDCINKFVPRNIMKMRGGVVG